MKKKKKQKEEEEEKNPQRNRSITKSNDFMLASL